MNNNDWSKLRKSSYDRVITGVCGGIAKATSIPSWIVRVMFVVAMLTGLLGLILYILLAVAMPMDLDR